MGRLQQPTRDDVGLPVAQPDPEWLRRGVMSVSVSVPLRRTDPAAPACQRGWCCRLRSPLPCGPINAVVVVVAKTDRDSGAGTALAVYAKTALSTSLHLWW